MYSAVLRGSLYVSTAPSFRLCPNVWMDEDATWYGSRPRPRSHSIRRSPVSPRKGHSSRPPFRPMSIVATVAHLSYCWSLVQNCGCRSLGFLKCHNCNGPNSQGANCITLPNLVGIRQTVVEIWRFLDFEDGGCRHLGFLIFEILTVGLVKRVELRHCAKFRADRSNVAEIWRFFDFSTWRPPILDF